MAAVVGVAADAPVGFAIGDAVAANVVVHDADDVSEADASGALVVVVSAATGICFVVVTAGVVCFYRDPFSFSIVSEVADADNVVVIVDACVVAIGNVVDVRAIIVAVPVVVTFRRTPIGAPSFIGWIHFRLKI